MYIEIKEINDELFKKSLSFFDEDYLDIIRLKNTFKESLIARYLIKNSQEYIDNPESFYSISHKDNLVFIGVNNSKIGLDIEILKNRDISLLDSFLKSEYDILGGKNLENFYYLWTSKESMIKFIGLTLDDMGEIILKSYLNCNEIINNIIFTKKFILEHNNVIYNVYSGNHEYKIYSLVF